MPAAKNNAAQQAGRPAPDLLVGRKAYEQQCARCHGPTGHGDGRDAKRLYPRPRDLTSGIFKFRSTASGTAPTDEDLFRTLEHGLTPGGMPDWSHLDETVRWQLVTYLKTLSDTFTSNPPEPVSIGQDPGRKGADLGRGRQVYEKLGCAACHGASGRANGTSAPTLTDTWGRAIRPADLTQGWNYRGGSEPQAIATRVLTGIDGTPMPSYAEAASVDDVWQLAYYVRSVQEEPRWTPITHAAYVRGALPDSAGDARWQVAERVDVRLRNAVNPAGEMSGPSTVTAVTFRALYNEDTISLRISWHDPTPDQATTSDALAVMLKPAELHGDVVTLQTWPLQRAPSLDLCFWSAGSGETTQRTYETLANRLETVLGHQPSDAMTLSGHAVYEDGQWTLVVSRPLARKELGTKAAQFREDGFTPVGFVVWDGGNPGQRAVSSWVDLALQLSHREPAAHQNPSPVVLGISGIVLVTALTLALRRP